MTTMMDADGRPLDPPAIIEHLYGSMLVTGKAYPDELPADLAPWYMYPADEGHCIGIVPLPLLGRHPPFVLLTATPVRTVLRLGWQMRDGWPVVDIAYDPDHGIVFPPEDEEQ